MKKWYSLIDGVQFPLKMLFISILIMGIGDFFINPNITVYTSVPSKEMYVFFQGLRYFGSFLIMNFPLFLLVKLLSKRYVDSVPSYVGVVAYILFHVVTMFLASTDLPSYCYRAIMGLQVDTTMTDLANTGVRYPLFTGILACIVIVTITRICYNNSRKRFMYGILGFVDNDSWSLITTMIFTSIVAVITTLSWPFFISGLNNLFVFIATDIYNPVNMFLYGITERVLTLFNLQDLIHQPFWFGELGGTWIESFGETFGKKFTGDVGVVTGLLAMKESTMGFGRFITPYYVMNLFAVPGMLLSFLTMFTDRLERRKYTLFFIIAIIASIMFGTLLPLELLLFVIAPSLYLMHVVAMSSLYAILTALSATIGYSFAGPIEQAMPGTFVSLLPFLGNPDNQNALTIVLIVGVICFVLYFLMTRAYYTFLVGDFLSQSHNAKRETTFIESIGGIANLKTINSSLNKVVVQLYNPQLIDYELLEELKVHKIAETRAGIMMEFGGVSRMLCIKTRKALAKHNAGIVRKPITEENEKENSSKQ